MKLLFVSNFFPPLRSAGSEKRALSYASEMQKRGHQVQVFCAGDFDKGKKYWNGVSDSTYLDIPVRHVNLNWIHAPDPNRYLYSNPQVENYLFRWLQDLQPDIVHIISCLTLSASVIHAAKKNRLPVVLTLTDYWFICPRHTLLHADGSMCDGNVSAWECNKCLMWDAKVFRWIDWFTNENISRSLITMISKIPLLSRNRGFRGMAVDMDHRKKYLGESINMVDFLIAPSKTLRDTFVNLGLVSQIYLDYSGHDLDWVYHIPEKVPSHKLRIGYLGQIIPIKGVHVLVEAFTQIFSRDEACLKIFGDLNQDNSYINQLENLFIKGNSDVQFLGEISHDQTGIPFSEIDILVVPSLWAENNPRVIHEAFASRTPVIASNVPGISEFIYHEVNGLLFERGSVVDLAHQLERCKVESGLLSRLQARNTPVKKICAEISELEIVYSELNKYLRR